MAVEVTIPELPNIPPKLPNLDDLVATTPPVNLPTTAGASPCGANAALEEALAGIDSLKEKLKGGLDSLTDVGALTEKVKAKLAEVNPTKTPSINLQQELSSLSGLTPEEYNAKVAALKKQFGDAVPDLDKIIAGIPKPTGMNAQGGTDIFGKINTALGNAAAVFQNVQDKIANASLDSVVSDICGKVPNVETTPNSDGTYSKPTEKPPAPVSPNKNPAPEPKASEPPARGFTFNFTKAKCIAAGGKAAGDWFDAMYEVLPKYNITTPERVAAFIANCRTETNWTTLEENLNYKAEYLFNHMNPGRKRFPTYEDALKVDRQPEKIANIVYMVGRKLLDPQPGDGWKYRGRGLIQLTFKENYLRASKAIFGDDRLVTNPDQVAKDKSIAIETACYYFKRTNVNAWADKQDWGNCRSIVNAGSPGKEPSKIHGYDTALKHSTAAYNALKG